MSPLGNGSAGIDFFSGTNDHVVRDNLLAFNGTYGLLIFTNNITVTGNTIRDNAFSGMQLSGTDNRIGGTTAAERNIITGNGQGGISIVGANAVSNFIQGNYIGVAADGVTADGNGNSGISTSGDADGNTIGGTEPGAGNLIANNGFAIEIDGILLNSSNNTVIGNTTRDNARYGVAVLGGVANNTIGGSTSAARNVIEGNGQSGVFIQGDSNSIVGNSIVANGGEGIFINGGANNTVGGTTAGAGNVITNNGLEGVRIAGAGTTGNRLQATGSGSTPAIMLPAMRQAYSSALTPAAIRSAGRRRPSATSSRATALTAC